MYFPYLRGKQFELLALRELVKLPILPHKISPIVEPLKKETKGLDTLVKALGTGDVSIQLVVNPEYGDLKSGSDLLLDVVCSLQQQGYSNVIPAFHINKDKDFKLLESAITNYGIDTFGYSLIHLNQISSVSELAKLFSSTNGKYNIIHVNHLVALRRSFPKSSVAYLSDPFKKQVRNVDYLEDTDENFSNDHLYYEDEGFVGYGDYLTIGAPYSDGGRLPFAVVIHLTYEETETSHIRIRHFVSDSNDDDSDIPGKFSEALEKLIEFVDENGIDTLAVREFKSLHSRGAYPGLGVIKKLSIMHHIELVQSLLEG
ncbi:MAG: sce7725 family protein [Sphingobacteriaceae bacterium]